jgi:arylsulfatase A-like enzyme
MAPKEWIDKFKGQFDMGWDRYREITLERQKKLGVVPADTKLTPHLRAIVPLRADVQIVALAELFQLLQKGGHGRAMLGAVFVHKQRKYQEATVPYTSSKACS